MRLYYRGPDATVTGDYFVHHAPGGAKSYSVGELRNVGISRAQAGSSPFPYAISGVAVLAGAALSMGAIPVLYALVGLAGSAAAAGTLAVRARRARPRPWILQADYRGATVHLYESADDRVFQQVARGLRRAIEDGRLRSAYEPNGPL
ncbi:DUF6232 family protein [Actinoplanes sp. NPDC049316]|uniref:DUF6232 family protein n=1 Tax=Actinoplanes sp. NPDC049316 TaxID=3154727 RepID=UPI00341E6720